MIERELRNCSYMSGDISPTNNTTVVLDALDLPIVDKCIGVVLALEVLEHMPDPGRMLREAERVLNDDGILIVTTPFMFGIHDLRDYFRYTPLGFQTLADAAGLDVVEVDIRGGTFVTTASLLRGLIRNTILGKPSDWRANGRRKKVLWLVVLAVEVPWVPIMWAAMGLDRVVDRKSKSPPGYFFLCTPRRTRVAA